MCHLGLFTLQSFSGKNYEQVSNNVPWVEV